MKIKDEDLAYAIGVTVGIWDTHSFDRGDVPARIASALNELRDGFYAHEFALAEHDTDNVVPEVPK